MKNKNLIIFGTLLIISILLISFGVAPTANKIIADKKIIIEEKNKMNDLLLKGQNIIKNKNNITKIEDQLKLLDDAYLKIGEELTFITDLEEVAAKNNIEQTIIFNNTESTEINSAKAIAISLQLSGGVKEIMSYINDLEKFDYYIDITKINLSSRGLTTSNKRAGEQTYEGLLKPEEEPTAILSANLSGLTYWK